MKTEFRFLGGADMVGRMGMTMECKGETMLVEYGMSPSKPPEYPLQAPRVKHAFLTHSHLDHCGMMPAVCGRDRCELFTTPLTAEVGEIMMHDSLKIAKAENYPQPYSAGDIERTMKSVVPLEFEDEIELDHFDVRLHNAGHVPGAAMFEFKGDTNTLYTGDLHTIPTGLTEAAQPVDCENLFIEGTYGGRLHPDRKATEREFLEKIDEVVDRGGTVVIPSFAIGRTQEIMILLKKRFSEVRTANMRKEARRADVIVTTGGMLDGGPVLNYLKGLKDDPKSAVLLVGYQAEDTNGRMLMESGAITVDGETHKIECEVQKYDFSAHADHKQIVNFVRACDPTNVILMHSETRELFLEDLADYNVILPKPGEAFQLDV